MLKKGWKIRSLLKAEFFTPRLGTWVVGIPVHLSISPMKIYVDILIRCTCRNTTLSHTELQAFDYWVFFMISGQPTDLQFACSQEGVQKCAGWGQPSSFWQSCGEYPSLSGTISARSANILRSKDMSFDLIDFRLEILGKHRSWYWWYQIYNRRSDLKGNSARMLWIFFAKQEQEECVAYIANRATVTRNPGPSPLN